MLIAIALAGTITGLAWFMEQNPLRVVLGGEAPKLIWRAGSITTLITRSSIASCRQTRASGSLTCAATRTTSSGPISPITCSRTITISKFVEESGTATEVLARARAAGITHLLVRQDVLLDYDQSPIVDDRRSRAENLEKMKILQAFLTEGTRVIRRDGRFILVELPR